jgi:microcystin-dependent protein
MATGYIGEIRLVGFNFAPSGWAMCNGQTLSISENEALFTLLGTTYGGDGQNTFALPNLQGRVPVHQGTGLSSYTLGEIGGVATVTLNTSQMPTHTHPVTCQTGAGTAGTAVNGVFAPAPKGVYATPGASVAMGSLVSSVGGSLSHDNMQPYLAMNYIISLYGVFPSQS